MNTNRFERGTLRIGRRSANIALITALLTFALTAIPAIGTILDQNGTIAARDAQIDSLLAEVNDANARLESRQESIEELRTENSELRAALPYSVDPEEVPAIRATATVTLADDGDKIDLNSILPNFGPSQDSYQNDSMRYDNESIRLGYGVSSVTLSEGTSSYENCAATTGYARTTSVEPHLLKEPTLCLRLTSGRYASIQVSRYDTDSVDAAITVWETPS